MENFKGTQGPLELKFVSGVCIGIGTIGPGTQQITANSVLPSSGEEYEQEREEILANMQLYATAPKLLKMITASLEFLQAWCQFPSELELLQEVKDTINEATTLPK